jgi:2-methylcitrate dehydratase
LEAIEAVQIGTFPFAMQAMGGPEKWHPKTRETADHSLPYVVASALLHGDLTMRHFDEAHLRDPRAGALMDRIKVDVDPESVERFPGDALNRVTITLADGSVHTAAVAHHRGHRLNPMSDIEIEAKFRSQAEPWIGSDRAGRLLDALWKLEQLTDLDSLTELTAVEAGRP